MARHEEASQSSSESASARFAVGTPVRVRKGVHDPDYADVPLGGWTGTIINNAISEEHGRTYLVEWDAASLRQMHPVYRFRCERDGLEVENSWLGEAELEPNRGETVPLEQPVQLTPRPLDPGEQDDRLRQVFQLTSDDPLPAPSRDNLAHYHRYLSDRLRFPLDALYAESSGYVPGKEIPVKLLGLAPLDRLNPEQGLRAEIKRPDGQTDEVALFDIETPRHDYARQLLGDYSYWFCEAFRYALVEGRRQEIRLEPPPLLPAAHFPLAAALWRCGLYGLLCGAVVGAIVGALEGARLGLIVAGGLCATLGYFLGSRLGFLLRALQLGQYAPQLGGFTGALAGGVLGAVFGSLLMAFPGTVLGCIAGFIVGRTLKMLGVAWPGSLLGSVYGAGLGGLALAFSLERTGALYGLLFGSLAGAAVGAILVFLVYTSLVMFQWQQQGAGNGKS